MESEKDPVTTGMKVDSEVNSQIAWDTENSKACDVDDMLKSFLLDCMVDQHATMNDAAALFNSCLERILSICNSAKSQSDFDSLNMIRENLGNYAKAGNEVDLYQAFVHATNAALTALRHLSPIDGLREPSDELVFHVSEQVMEQFQQGALFTPRPKVILVSDTDAQVRRMHKDDHDMYFGVVVKTTRKTFEWRNIRTFIEFRTDSTRSPPSQYIKGKYIEHRGVVCKYVPLKSSNVNGSAIAHSAVNSLGDSEFHGDCPGKQSSPNVSGSTGMLYRHPKRKVTVLENECQSQQEFGERSSQRPKSYAERQKRDTNQADLDEIHAFGQTGTYVAEMFASHVDRLHAISLTIVGDLLYVSRHDRQGVVQYSVLNVTQDLPRVLVLLLTMQRFQNCHWGLNSIVDPSFGGVPAPITVHIKCPRDGQIDITSNLLSGNRVTHYCPKRRAKNVSLTTSKKIEWRGKMWDIMKNTLELRRREPDVLNLTLAMVSPPVSSDLAILILFEHFDEIAEEIDGQDGQLASSRIFSDSSTVTIPERIDLPKGVRILYSIIFQDPLMPITELVKDEKLKCWWYMMLWLITLKTNGVPLSANIVPSCLVYKRKRNNVVGVLIDFDY